MLSKGNERKIQTSVIPSDSSANHLHLICFCIWMMLASSERSHLKYTTTLQTVLLYVIWIKHPSCLKCKKNRDMATVCLKNKFSMFVIVDFIRKRPAIVAAVKVGFLCTRSNVTTQDWVFNVKFVKECHHFILDVIHCYISYIQETWDDCNGGSLWSKITFSGNIVLCIYIMWFINCFNFCLLVFLFEILIAVAQYFHSSYSKIVWIRI